MYATPSLAPLDVAASDALCCEVHWGDKTIRTPACGTVICDLFETCSVTVPIPPPNVTG